MKDIKTLTDLELDALTFLMSTTTKIEVNQDIITINDAFFYASDCIIDDEDEQEKIFIAIDEVNAFISYKLNKNGFERFGEVA